MHRQRLPNRRDITTINFEHDGQRYVTSAAIFDDGRLAELFVNSAGKVGSASDITVADAAVAISIALQYGADAETIRAALKRNPDGTAQGPLGHALDLFIHECSIVSPQTGGTIEESPLKISSVSNGS
jgi:hypothetical protein